MLRHLVTVGFKAVRLLVLALAYWFLSGLDVPSEVVVFVVLCVCVCLVAFSGVEGGGKWLSVDFPEVEM